MSVAPSSLSFSHTKLPERPAPDKALEQEQREQNMAFEQREFKRKEDKRNRRGYLKRSMFLVKAKGQLTNTLGTHGD